MVSPYNMTKLVVCTALSSEVDLRCGADGCNGYGCMVYNIKVLYKEKNFTVP